MTDQSVTQWINGLKEGDDYAAQQIWQQYFDQLVRLARKKLGMLPRRATDEEDVAVSAFDSFCRNAANGRFPKLEDREDLWKLLFTITERKAIAHAKRERRQKRGGGKVRGQSVFVQPGNTEAGNWNDAQPAREPSPAFAAEVADQVRQLLDDLDDHTLRQVATLKMAGATNDEVATELGCSQRSVKRKLQVIRTIWSKGLS